MSKSISETKTKVLPVLLNDDELLKRAKTMAELDKEHTDLIETAEQVVEEAKAEAKQLTAQAKGLRTDIVKLRRTVSSGFEDQDVEYIEKADHINNVVQMIRLDTGEIFADRPMQAEDKQLPLFNSEIDGALEQLAASSVDDEPSPEVTDAVQEFFRPQDKRKRRPEAGA